MGDGVTHGMRFGPIGGPVRKVTLPEPDYLGMGNEDPKGHDAAIKLVLPVGRQDRKDIPLCSGVFDYFTAALIEIAKISKAGNDQHNPGQPLHWARGKSMDHSDCIARHLMERGTIDPEDGMRHSAKLAWRALALLQQELEDAGAPLSRGSK